MKEIRYKFVALFIIIGLISFYLARGDFNSYVYSTLFSYDNNIHEDVFVKLVVEDKVIDQTKVFNDFLTKIDDLKLNAYAVKNDNLLVPESTIFYHSNDIDYKSSIILSNSQSVFESHDKVFSTFSENKSLRIYTIFGTNKIELKPMNLNDPDFTLTNWYQVCGKEVDFAEKTRTVCSYLNTEYGDICDIEVYERYDNHNSETFNYSILVGFSIVLFFGFLVNSSLLQKTMEISKRKLEGQSNLSIFYDCFLKYIIVNSVALLIIYFLGISLIIPLPITKIIVFIKSLLINSILLIALTLVIGMLYYYEIANIPINLSIKGKNYANKVVAIIRILKTIVLVLGLSFFFYSLRNVYDFAFGYLNKVQNNLKNRGLYSISFIKGIYFTECSNKYASEDMRKAYDELVRSAKAFNFYRVELENMFDGNSGLSKQKAACAYEVSFSFLANNELTMEVPEITTVYLYGNRKLSIKEEKAIADIYGDFLVVKYDWNVYFYNQDGSDFFVTPFVREEILVYNVKNTYDFDVFGLFFYFDGSLNEATDSLNEVLKVNNMSSYFILESKAERYNIFYQYALHSTVFDVSLCFIYILALALINKQIIQLDQIDNGKRYFLEYLEGNRLGFFFLNVIVLNLITFVSVQCVFYLIQHDIFLELLTVGVLLSILEVIISYFYHRRIVDETKGE